MVKAAQVDGAAGGEDLLGEVRGAQDGGAQDFVAVEELAGDQAGLDRLADADVVGDEETTVG